MLTQLLLERIAQQQLRQQGGSVSRRGGRCGA